MSSACLARRFAGSSRTSQTVATTSSSVATARRLFSARRVSHRAPFWARFCSRPTYHPSVSSIPAMASNTTSMLTIRSCSWPCEHQLFVPVCRRSRPAPSTLNAGLPRTTFCSKPTSQRSWWSALLLTFALRQQSTRSPSLTPTSRCRQNWNRSAWSSTPSCRSTPTSQWWAKN